MRSAALIFLCLLSIGAHAQSQSLVGDLKERMSAGMKSLHDKIQEGRNAYDHLQELQQAVIEKKDPKAFNELDQLAKKGNPSALVFIGVMYDQGLGGQKRDSYRGAQYFHAAATRGDPLAAYNLGLMYLYGRDLPRSREDAGRLFQIAAKGNVKYAAVNLGMMAEENKKWEEAVRWYKMATGDRKHDVATLKYGLALFKGQGVTKHVRDAMILIRQAADTWNSEALLALAEIHANGLGVPENRLEAAKWLEILSHGPRPYDKRLFNSLLIPLSLNDSDINATRHSAAIWIDAHPFPEEVTDYTKTIWRE